MICSFPGCTLHGIYKRPGEFPTCESHRAPDSEPINAKTRITIDEAKAGMATATGELWAAYNTIVSLTFASNTLEDEVKRQDEEIKELKRRLEFCREALR